MTLCINKASIANNTIYTHLWNLQMPDKKTRELRNREVREETS